MRFRRRPVMWDYAGLGLGVPGGSSRDRSSRVFSLETCLVVGFQICYDFVDGAQRRGLEKAVYPSDDLLN
jgi:hypothetical protein